MEMQRDVVRVAHGEVVVVSFSGRIAPGSEGNEAAAEGGRFIRASLSAGAVALIVDATRLQYVMGNYIGSWILGHTLPVRLVATGETGRALDSLLAWSGLEAVLGPDLLQPSLESALASLPAKTDDGARAS
jgi:hypothetical protein